MLVNKLCLLKTFFESQHQHPEKLENSRILFMCCFRATKLLQQWFVVDCVIMPITHFIMFWLGEYARTSFTMIWFGYSCLPNKRTYVRSCSGKIFPLCTQLLGTLYAQCTVGFGAKMFQSRKLHQRWKIVLTRNVDYMPINKVSGYVC